MFLFLDVIKSKGLKNVTVEALFEELTPHGRGNVSKKKKLIHATTKKKLNMLRPFITHTHIHTNSHIHNKNSLKKTKTKKIQSKKKFFFFLRFLFFF